MWLIIPLGLQFEIRTPVWESWSAYGNKAKGWFHGKTSMAEPAKVQSFSSGPWRDCCSDLYSSDLLSTLKSNQVNWSYLFLIMISPNQGGGCVQVWICWSGWKSKSTSIWHHLLWNALLSCLTVINTLVSKTGSLYNPWYWTQKSQLILSIRCLLVLLLLKVFQ